MLASWACQRCSATLEWLLAEPVYWYSGCWPIVCIRSSGSLWSQPIGGLMRTCSAISSVRYCEVTRESRRSSSNSWSSPSSVLSSPTLESVGCCNQAGTSWRRYWITLVLRICPTATRTRKRSTSQTLWLSSTGTPAWLSWRSVSCLSIALNSSLSSDTFPCSLWLSLCIRSQWLLSY